MRKIRSDRTNTSSSSVFDLASPTSGDSTGDNSDLVHYRADFIILGLPSRVPIVRREGIQTKGFGL